MTDKALKLTCEIFTLERPERDDIETNGRIFVQPEDDDYESWQKNAESFSIIHGAMATHLCGDNQKDLCTLAPQAERDPLTRLVESKHQLRRMIKVYLTLSCCFRRSILTRLAEHNNRHGRPLQVQNLEQSHNMDKRLCGCSLACRRNCRPLLLEERSWAFDPAQRSNTGLRVLDPLADDGKET